MAYLPGSAWNQFMSLDTMAHHFGELIELQGVGGEKVLRRVQRLPPPLFYMPLSGSLVFRIQMVRRLRAILKIAIPQWLV